jgi:hypothetical protein
MRFLILLTWVALGIAACAPSPTTVASSSTAVDQTYPVESPPYHIP